MQVLLATFAFSLLFAAMPSFAMGPFDLQHILAATRGTPRALDGVTTVDGIGTNSRTIQPGELFWALSGPNHDGHDYVPEAIARGAVAGVVQQDRQSQDYGPAILVPDTLQALWDFAAWHRTQTDALMIGVTGSFGKTTTREMIFAALSTRYDGVRSPKNYNNHIGVPLTLLELIDSHEFAVIELGASAIGEIRQLSKLAEPEIGVLTGIGPAHLDGFGSLDGVIAAKGELLDSLTETGLAVGNGDDPVVRTIVRNAACNTLLAGETDNNHVRPEQVEMKSERIRIRVDGHDYHIRATGRHHVPAAVIAIGIAKEVGVSAADIAEGLDRFLPMTGRSRLQRFGNWHVIDDTYNANPASMKAACDTLRDWSEPGKRILIAGDMLELGELSEQLHLDAGRIIGNANIEHVIAYGEYARHIVAAAMDAGMESRRLADCQSLETALAVLDCWLEPGDVVLVKGSRALQMERIVTWLKDKATHDSQENIFRTPVRACA